MVRNPNLGLIKLFSVKITQFYSADESFNLKKNLIESKLDELTIDIGPKLRTFGTSR